MMKTTITSILQDFEIHRNCRSWVLAIKYNVDSASILYMLEILELFSGCIMCSKVRSSVIYNACSAQNSNQHFKIEPIKMRILFRGNFDLSPLLWRRGKVTALYRSVPALIPGRIDIFSFSQ